MATELCGASFVTADYKESFTCVRSSDWHLAHEGADGTRVVWMPGGALISRPEKE